MRVTFITTHLNLTNGGGSNHSFHLVASELARRGHDVSVVFLNPASNQGVEGAPYRLIDARYQDGPRLQRVVGVATLLRRHQHETDVYHLYNPLLVFAGGLYRLTGGQTPVVVTLNDYQPVCSNQNMMTTGCWERCGVLRRFGHNERSVMRKPLSLLSYAAERFPGFAVAEHVDRLLPDSESLRQVYEWAGLPMRHSTVVPEVIDVDLFPARGERSPWRPAGGEPFRLLFVGRLERYKGVDLLLEAVTRLDIPFQLEVVGDGRARPLLERQVSVLGLDERVRFHGWVPNEQTLRLYEEAHAFVHPGRWPEPFGRTVLEALSTNLPVVASDVGEPPVLARSYGLVFRSEDSKDLARALTQLAAEHEAALAKARQGHEQAAAFDYRRIVPTIEQVYERVLSARSGGGGVRASRHGP